MKDIKTTIVIPCYKAHSTLPKLLHNISTLSVDVKVIISNDEPNTSYQEIISQFPNLDIIEISTDKNTGAGLSRQRGLDHVKTDWVTFIDADDVFASPFAIEQLENGIVNKQTVVVQGAFLQEARDVSLPNERGEMQEYKLTFMPRNDVGHPWVFGRLYNVKFVRENGISFSELRAMEDQEFNSKIRMLIEGSPYNWNIINDPIYYWSIGSEHSITRSTWEERPNIPQYNFGACALGSAICYKQALDFVSKKSPFNPSIPRTASELMIDKYFTYYECLNEYPEYAEQNNFISSWWYHKVFTKYAPSVSDEMLEEMFMQFLQGGRLSTFKKFPKESFIDWFTRIKIDDCSIDRLDKIRDNLPKSLKESENKTGCATEEILEMIKKIN